MFTGIVEDTGTVAEMLHTGLGVRLVVESALDWSDTKLGDSVSVSGVCLTVVKIAGARVSFDLGPETLAVTTLGELKGGARVHLERAVRLSDRLGGHLVSGHVDAIGAVTLAEMRGDSLFLRIHAPPEVMRLCIPKGSITVEGTSLTINAVDADAFEVCLVPHTLAVTRLGQLGIGDRVNLEADLIGKYIERLMAPRA
jgi:riboflavin synthase